MAKEIEKIVKLTLIRIGVKCDLIGFSYLAKAIEYAIAEPMQVYNLKGLFADVAKFYGVKNPFRVEANIQNAITFTYNNKGFDVLNKLFGMEVVKKGYKPTSAEVIKLVAEYYEMGLYKNVV
ncbi:MAG: sporulation initiation factor Spo0A C-terminal domain-containing protein [Candidatus Caccovivens sp.]